jgi:hypothetical protein
LSDIIPLVEFTATTPTNRSGETTTGSINPGFLWEQPDYQLGVEAVIGSAMMLVALPFFILITLRAVSILFCDDVCLAMPEIDEFAASSR